MLTPQEINERMAEIMGWPIITENTPFREVVQFGGYIIDGQCYRFTGIGYNKEKIDFYSNIADAFMVLHKWLEDHLDYSPKLGVAWDGEHPCYCWLEAIAMEEFVGMAPKYKWSQAICNCLMQAKEVE